MRGLLIKLPDIATIRNEAQFYLQVFFGTGRSRMQELPVHEASWDDALNLPPQLEMVRVPSWASSAGHNQELLVPLFCICRRDDEAPAWKTVDWWAAVFWYINGVAERAHESIHGPVHSYSQKLKNWDSRMWEHAWVNRIALFLRAWVAHIDAKNEDEIFDAVERPVLYLTHDVDAIRKNLTLRCKQTAFYSYNAVRMACRFQLRKMCRYGARAFRFFVTSPDYRNFEEILEIEKGNGIRGVFNFFAAGLHPFNEWKLRLFDPRYDIVDPETAEHAKLVLNSGGVVGLHQSWGSWENPKKMERERKRLQSATNQPVQSCRQHWLMFSWEKTWRTQESVGLKVDTTLGFNDRPGFRNSGALRCHPWNFEKNCRHELESIPMVLMDSHLYNYKECSPEERNRIIDNILDEISAVMGTATVIWHTQVLGPDYGWRDGFLSLVEGIRKRFLRTDERIS